MRYPIVLGATILCALLSSAAARADDDLLAIVKSGQCPKKLEKYTKVKTSEFCAGMDNRDCNTSNTQCFDELSACWKQVTILNKQIFTYNAFIDKCNAKK